MIKDESALQTANFWYDLNSIEKYCHAILTYFKKDVSLTIRLGNQNEVPRVNVEKSLSGTKDRYNLIIPKIASFLNEDQLKEQINLRKTFLKHELSHICFTPMVELNMLHNGNDAVLKDVSYLDKRDIQMIYNALEDIRIERLMGNNLEGTNDSFFEAVREIAIKNDWVSKIANEKISPLLFGIFAILRSKNIFSDNVLKRISDFKNIEAYESVFKKYSDFHEKLSQENMVDIISYLKNILADIKKIQSHFNQLEVQQASQQSQQEQQQQNDEDVSTMDLENLKESEEKQQQIQTQSYPSPNAKGEDSAQEESETDNDDANGDSEIEESASLSEDDNDDMTEDQQSGGNSGSDENDDKFDEEMESDIEQKKMEDEIVQNANKKNNSKEPDNSSLESNLKKQFQDSLKDIKRQNSSDLKEDIDELKKEMEDVTKENVFEIDSYGNLKESSYEVLNRVIASQSTNEQLADNYSKMFSAVEIPLKEIWRMSVSAQKIKKSANIYSVFVRKHTKEISLLSAYFKNKFKDKKKITMVSNKEDGFLDDQMLYKALSNKGFETKIFLQVGKKISTHANFIFLLDFSGSMSGSKLMLLTKTMIILNEVLNKIGIKFMIYSFSGSSGSFTLPNESMHRFIKSPYLNRQGNSYYLKDNLSSDHYPFVYLLKKLEEKQSIPLKAFLGNIIANRGDFNCLRVLSKMGFSIGASTKEYQSMVYLTKKYDHMKNKNMIIVNDGHYDQFAYDDNMSSDNFSYNEKDEIASAVSSTQDQVLFDFLYERTIKLNKISYDMFAKMIKDFCILKIEKDSFLRDTESQMLVEYGMNLAAEFKNEFEYFSKKDFIKCKYFDITLKKNNDYIYMKLKSKDSFTSMFTVNKEKIEYYSYMKNGNIFFQKSDKKVLYNIILEKLNYRYKSSLFNVGKNTVRLTGVYSNFNSNNSFGDQLYKNKINLLRKRNWGIYGIGIHDASQAAYIGDKNSSVIMKTENLTKEISKILY
jgi:hypothetical protein